MFLPALFIVMVKSFHGVKNTTKPEKLHRRGRLCSIKKIFSYKLVVRAPGDMVVIAIG
jgi:hypothetical protein